MATDFLGFHGLMDAAKMTLGDSAIARTDTGLQTALAGSGQMSRPASASTLVRTSTSGGGSTTTTTTGGSGGTTRRQELQ